MFSDAKEHIRDKLRCRPTGAVASARPRESAAIFPYALYYSLVHRPAEFLFTFRLLLFSRLFSFSFCLALFCFLDKAGVFVGSSVVVPPVFPFFSPCLPCPLKKIKKIFLSLLLFLHLLRVHSCWGFVCSFASFVDFPFFFWRVSCEKGFSPF